MSELFYTDGTTSYQTDPEQCIACGEYTYTDSGCSNCDDNRNALVRILESEEAVMQAKLAEAQRTLRIASEEVANRRHMLVKHMIVKADPKRQELEETVRDATADIEQLTRELATINTKLGKLGA